jgi:hypothetical protein
VVEMEETPVTFRRDMAGGGRGGDWKGIAVDETEMDRALKSS